MSANVAGAAVETPREPAVTSGSRLIAERFRLLEPLGRGGMGRVYRGHDELLNRPVAVKLIYDDAIGDSDVRHACALEARAAARLSHPGIVRILDSGFADGHLYVVMSLAEGDTLTELLRRAGPLPPERALAFATQVADALGAAHREGIVHCDVKPSNLIVRPDGQVQLVDFGIARIAASTTSLDASTRQGSAEYVAPEQVEGAAVDARTDLYALGIVLFEMLTGQTPFGGGTLAAVLARRLVADAPSVRETRPELPGSIERLVERMLTRDPARRFQTAGELFVALEAARKSLPTEIRTPPPVAMTATMPFRSLRPAFLPLWQSLTGASRSRRPSIAGGMVITMIVGLVLAALLARWGVDGARTEVVAASVEAASAGGSSREPPLGPATMQPTAAPALPPTALPTIPPTPLVEPTAAPPTPTPPSPSATPPPLPTSPPPPAAAPPADAGSDPAAASTEPPAPRVLAAPQPQPPASRPAPAKHEEKKPAASGPPAQGNSKQDAKPAPGNGRGNGNGSGQKKR